MGFGASIRQRRLNKSLTQSQLALMLGVSQGYLSKLEKEIILPDTDVVNKIDDILGVEVENPTISPSDPKLVNKLFYELDYLFSARRYDEVSQLIKRYMTRKDIRANEGAIWMLSYWEVELLTRNGPDSLKNSNSTLGKALMLLNKARCVETVYRVMLYHKIGVIYRNKRDFDKAIYYLNEGIKLFPVLGSDAIKAQIKILYELNIVYQVQEDASVKAERVLQETIKLIDRHLPFYMKHKANVTYLHATLNLMEEKNIADALKYLGRSLSYFKRIGDVSSMISCLNNIGHAHQMLGDKEKSHLYYTRAVQLANKHPGKIPTATQMSLAAEGYFVNDFVTPSS